MYFLQKKRLLQRYHRNPYSCSPCHVFLYSLDSLIPVKPQLCFMVVINHQSIYWKYPHEMPIGKHSCLGFWHKKNDTWEWILMKLYIIFSLMIAGIFCIKTKQNLKNLSCFSIFFFLEKKSDLLLFRTLKTLKTFELYFQHFHTVLFSQWEISVMISSTGFSLFPRITYYLLLCSLVWFS